MLPAFMSRPLTGKRYPMVTDHGSEVRDYTAEPSTFTFYGSVQPGTGTEELLNRNGADVVKTVWAQPGSGVRHDDVVTVDGVDYQVNGAPEEWRTGVLDHDVIRLSAWRG